MRDRLIELIGEYHAHPERFCPRMDTDQPCSGCKYDLGVECNQDGKLADHLLKSGVIVPPCKVGDTVWFIRDRKIIETKVDKIVLKHGGLYLHLSCNSFYETTCRSIGKTVFLTREEAEAAFAERSEG